MTTAILSTIILMLIAFHFYIWLMPTEKDRLQDLADAAFPGAYQWELTAREYKESEYTREGHAKLCASVAWGYARAAAEKIVADEKYREQKEKNERN